MYYINRMGKLFFQYTVSGKGGQIKKNHAYGGGGTPGSFDPYA